MLLIFVNVILVIIRCDISNRNSRLNIIDFVSFFLFCFIGGREYFESFNDVIPDSILDRLIKIYMEN